MSEFAPLTHTEMSATIAGTSGAPGGLGILAALLDSGGLDFFADAFEGIVGLFVSLFLGLFGAFGLS